MMAVDEIHIVVQLKDINRLYIHVLPINFREILDHLLIHPDSYLQIRMCF